MAALALSAFTYLRTSIWRSVDKVQLVGRISYERSGVVEQYPSVRPIGFGSSWRKATIENIGDHPARNVTMKIIGSDGKVKNERDVAEVIGSHSSFWVRTDPIPDEQETWIIEWDHPHWVMRLFKRRRRWVHFLND
ncbi:hypothetical protein [Rothia sp. L_38]|uniref:hypothetical protein n=1 Tax=Rothia sp. L_38 TaxID=3422315 RepID=UPI003D6B5E5A